jgi:hypothetical protein
MHSPSLKNLKAAMDRAAAAEKATLEAARDQGDDVPWFPQAAYLDERGSKEMWRLVSQVNARERALYNRFSDAHELGDHILEIVAELPAPSWQQLVTALEKIAAENPQWLVEVPLANLIPPRPYIALALDAGLGIAEQDENWSPITGNPPYSAGEPFRHLGDRIPTSARWRREADDQRIDTRRTAALLLIENGTEGVALKVATARARYAIATWTLLAAPERGEPWPTVGDWAPRPFLHYELDRKPYEKDVWMQKERVRGRRVSVYEDVYVLPNDSRILEAPFQAMALAGTSRSARAVLSGAWSLYLADREPNEIGSSDRLLHIYAALEALSEHLYAPSPSRVQRIWRIKRSPRSESKWAHALDRQKIWNEVSQFYSPRERRDARNVAKALRNLAAHSADAAAANLGYQIPGSAHDVALAQASTSLPLLRECALRLARRGWEVALESQFDDASYEVEMT